MSWPASHPIKGRIDWNELSLDEMVEFLRSKYMFLSSGEAKCVMELIDFYEKHKEVDK